MKDSKGRVIGENIIAVSNDGHEVTHFAVVKTKDGFLFIGEEYSFKERDMELLTALGIKIYIAEECSECGKFFDPDDLGTCKECGGSVCQDCQQPCKGPPHPMVDYSVHRQCYEESTYDWLE